MKIGNSLGAILPAESLNGHHLEEGDELFVRVDAEGIWAVPNDPELEDSLEAARCGMKKYGNALRKLGRKRGRPISIQY